ncbi:MAG: shikimate kinase [Anaerotruncus massiliensis (ex Togo et al. 2019)]
MNNIILCGFMGCGKTTVGTLLARRLGMEYADLDAEIEAEAGMAIPAIFAEYGEGAFPRPRARAVRALAGRADCVVSTGGGALTYPRNREVLSRATSSSFSTRRSTPAWSASAAATGRSCGAAPRGASGPLRRPPPRLSRRRERRRGRVRRA